MNGVIDGKTVIKHTILIIQEFGLKTYCVCLKEIILGTNATFLEVICKCEEKKDEGPK